MLARPRATLLLALPAAAALALLAPGGAHTRADDEPDGGVHPDIRTAAGKVSAIAWQDRRLTLDASDGPLTVAFDRNTTVFLENRLGTLRDVAVGLPVRVSYGPDKRAFWLEVRPRSVTAPAGGDAADGGAPDRGRTSGAPQLPSPPVPDGGEGAPGGVAGAPDGGEPAPPSEPSPGRDAPPAPSDGTRPPMPPGPAGPGPLPGPY